MALFHIRPIVASNGYGEGSILCSVQGYEAAGEKKAAVVGEQFWIRGGLESEGSFLTQRTY